MNIGNYLANNYDSSMQGAVKAEQKKESSNVKQADDVRALANLSGLKEGSVFKGEVLDVNGQKITIELENQAKLLARLQSGVELSVGDRLLFSVKENQNHQILLKPLFDSLYSAQTQTLEKVLDAAGLSPTERNFSAAKELMDAGLPVDKASIVKLLSQSMKFENTSMQTLTMLQKMNIPVTQENITQFERYQNGTHQLTADLEQTANSMVDFTKMLPKDLQGKEILTFAQDFLNLLDEPDFQSESLDVTFHVEDSEHSQLRSSNDVSMNSFIVEKFVEEEKSYEFVESVESVESNLEQTEETQKESVYKKEKMPIQEDKIQQNTETMEKSSLGRLAVDKESLKHLEAVLQKEGISPQQIREGLKENTSTINILKDITQILQKSNLSDSSIHAVISSDAFKKVLLDVVKESWAIDPMKMKNPKEIDRLYERIEKQTKAFEQKLSASGGDSREFSQNSQNMRQNMRFMEQLNQQMIYAQMPLKLTNQNTNSELYVYADKRNLAQKRDGISVMLHLDMDHLGTTDIKVTLTGTQVNARFYLNEQESVDIIAENMEQLEHSLNERGFSLTNEVIKRKPAESMNMVVDEVIDENAEKSIKRYTFDMRT